MPTTVFDLSKFVFPLDRGEADEVLLDVPASDAAGPNESLSRALGKRPRVFFGLSHTWRQTRGFVPQCEM